MRYIFSFNIVKKCKLNKVVKDQFRSFIVKEFQKCIQHLVRSGHSRSPIRESHDDLSWQQQQQVKKRVPDPAAPIIVEHREKNIFSNKGSRSRSKNSGGTGAVRSSSPFPVINEEEEELKYQSSREQDNKRNTTAAAGAVRSQGFNI